MTSFRQFFSYRNPTLFALIFHFLLYFDVPCPPSISLSSRVGVPQRQLSSSARVAAGRTRRGRSRPRGEEISRERMSKREEDGEWQGIVREI